MTYTPTPNALFDIYLKKLRGSELKVLLVLIRKTFGFVMKDGTRKTRDKISISQICSETGLGRAQIIVALTSLEHRFFLISSQKKPGMTTTYDLCFNGTRPESETVPVQKVDRTRPESETVPVQKVNTQKKLLKKIEKNIPAEYLAMASALAEKIEQNDKKYFSGKNKPGITEKWSDSFRLLVERDKREQDEIYKVITWCQNDSFWKSNILSGQKLRDKYPQLILRMRQQKVFDDKPKKTGAVEEIERDKEKALHDETLSEKETKELVENIFRRKT